MNNLYISLSGNFYNINSNYNTLSTSFTNFKYKDFFVGSVNSTLNTSTVTLTTDISNNYLFNFQIQQGIQGIQGETGPQGAAADLFKTGNPTASSALETIIGMIAGMAYSTAMEALQTAMGMVTMTSLQSQIVEIQARILSQERDIIVLQLKVESLQNKITKLEYDNINFMDQIVRLEEKTANISCNSTNTTIYGALNVFNPGALDFTVTSDNVITGNTQINGRLIYNG